VPAALPLRKHLEAQEKIDQQEARLRKFPSWDSLELRLRHKWPPDKVLAWHQKHFPGEPAPSRRTLFRYLATGPKSWFVSSLDEAELGTEVVPRLLVLERQVTMIRVMEERINRALE